MYRIVLSFLFLILINLSYVDLHAYSHLFEGEDNPIQECDHDNTFRNGETISYFLAPQNVDFAKSNFQYIQYDKCNTLLYYPTVRFLAYHYTNLPPPELL